MLLDILCRQSVVEIVWACSGKGMHGLLLYINYCDLLSAVFEVGPQALVPKKGYLEISFLKMEISTCILVFNSKNYY
jgi:hypothetical protein